MDWPPHEDNEAVDGIVGYVWFIYRGLEQCYWREHGTLSTLYH